MTDSENTAISEEVKAPWLQSQVSAPAIPRTLCVWFVDVKTGKRMLNGKFYYRVKFQL